MSAIRHTGREHRRARPRAEERGAVAAEYGLLASLIAIAVLGAVLLLGEHVLALFAGAAQATAALASTPAGG